MRSNRIPDAEAGVRLPGEAAAEVLWVRDGRSGALLRQYHSDVLSSGIRLPEGASSIVVRNLDDQVLRLNGTLVRGGESYYQEGAGVLLPALTIEGASYQLVVLY